MHDVNNIACSGQILAKYGRCCADYRKYTDIGTRYCRVESFSESDTDRDIRGKAATS